MENDKENKIGKIPLYKKFWYSITKFERYPNMASEGVGRAIKYLLWLILIFSLILVIGFIIKFHGLIRRGIDYLDKNIEQISYENGKLLITPSINGTASFGNLIINTDELSDEEIQKYENSSNRRPEFIWLNDRVIAKYNQNSIDYYYKDIFRGFGIEKFNKQQALDFLISQTNSPKTYIVYGAIALIYTFLAYFISTLLDIIILSIFGLLTTIIAKIKMRYRAIFNMSVYAITLSTVLRLIYLYIELFTNFNIKYFDLMYTAISFICLAAAIFMIKSDVIKQQLQIMQMMEIRRQKTIEENENELDKEKEEEQKEEKEENNKDENDKEKKEKKEGEVNNDVEGQGSNA